MFKQFFAINHIRPPDVRKARIVARDVLRTDRGFLVSVQVRALFLTLGRIWTDMPPKSVPKRVEVVPTDGLKRGAKVGSGGQ